ncbi:MAG: hypothetical protein ACRCXZ_05990 [Patescibacteria group bacterium]
MKSFASVGLLYPNNDGNEREPEMNLNFVEGDILEVRIRKETPFVNYITGVMQVYFKRRTDCLPNIKKMAWHLDELVEKHVYNSSASKGELVDILECEVIQSDFSLKNNPYPNGKTVFLAAVKREGCELHHFELIK